MAGFLFLFFSYGTAKKPLKRGPPTKKGKKGIIYRILLIVLMQRVQIVIFLPFTFLLWRLGLNFLLEAILEWEREWPERLFLPQIWQVAILLKS